MFCVLCAPLKSRLSHCLLSTRVALGPSCMPPCPTRKAAAKDRRAKQKFAESLHDEEQETHRQCKMLMKEANKWLAVLAIERTYRAIIDADGTMAIHVTEGTEDPSHQDISISMFMREHDKLRSQMQRARRPPGPSGNDAANHGAESRVVGQAAPSRSKVEAGLREVLRETAHLAAQLEVRCISGALACVCCRLPHHSCLTHT